MLMVLAISSRETMKYSSGFGKCSRMLADNPCPLTRPMRALTIWMPIISGVVKKTDHSSP